MDSLFEIDQLQLYFGDPYVINNNITIFQPTVGEIMKYGEKRNKILSLKDFTALFIL